ncbi:helix-turn-helix domain-containing protein [Citrobacter sp. Ct235]|uniref:winged helix-turn-helix transcriptional regulator n=1 Tax=Citrobacter sp. Ct235 TaxID=2985157 RepID=UPI002576944E|nr:winged helix-turn-helix transcriptional regulator [Citrobacter sp. Ct235]MDM2734932.1 helix-turn-helix domain-containing protein [Citrobacter sp. Ct235]
MNTKITIATLPLAPSTQAIKPEAEIDKIIEQISPFATSFKCARGEILRFYTGNKRTCYLLHQGGVTLNRRGDGMILNSENATFILGVSNPFSQSENLYVRVTENALISQLPLERFNLLIERNLLWESMCKFLLYTVSRVYEHCTLISQMSSYEIIRFQLQELMSEPDQIRSSITAANYIKGRTYLSRSGIMRILADLRDAGYIELNRGVLVTIKHLPKKY